MNEALKTMLARYKCRSIVDYENALKEIIQEISLLGLWRSKFFEKAAMYGGSALRILYGLDRFSEDLDFSLYKKNKKFSLSGYCKAIEDELKSFDLSVAVERKKKTVETNIESAFVKAGTLKNMIIIDLPRSSVTRMHPGKMMKIKLEVDIDPPGKFEVEAKYLFLPVPFSINAYTQPSLFAGKLHAILCRSWGARVKGRDWYDLVWYTARDIPVHLRHLESRMRQSGHYTLESSLTKRSLKKMLLERIQAVDFNKAKKDVETFLSNTASLKLWSKKYFIAVCDRITIF